jgi:actin-related protein
MINNIVLAGGTTMMTGFTQRIANDLYNYFDDDFVYHPPNIVAENYRYNSTWIGASMLGSMSTFKNLFITKEEFNEIGEGRFQYFQKIF